MKKNKLLLSIVSIILCACSPQNKYEEARTPEASISTFDILNGFKAEVFAAEPQVTDPVELTFDEEGNAYVIEMGDYPYKAVRGDGKGRIRKLIDRDGDGRTDTSIIFAEKFESGTSILPWEGGLLVTAAPEILFLKDTTGDDKADIREVLFKGFFEDNSEAQITSIRYGIDNWIYANNGGQAGLVTFTRNPAAPALQIKGGDFRFRLDRGLFEVESGAGQYGMEMDDLGHRFYTNNSRHISTSPIPARYLKRQKYMNFRSVMNIYAAEPVMYQATPAPWWRAERTKARQQQYDEKKLNRKEYAEGRFTGASGGTIYAGDAYPASFYGSYFVGDVAGNLVHRDVITKGNEGPFFSAARSAEEQKREFIASTDSWFRPCNFTLGYDGNLYMIDMYRQHIETPVSIPDSLKEDMDFMRGNQMGRIYRIVSTAKQQQQKMVPAMRQQSTAELINYLSHGNRWWRLNAQRLILERKDRSAIPALRALFTDAKNPIVRLHALYTLEGLDALDANLVQNAMKDGDAGLREHGAILSERFPQLAAQVINMMNDTSGLVSLQATLSAGQLPGQQAVPAFAVLLEKKHKDPWFMNAILSAEAGSSFALVDELAKHTAFFNTPDSMKLAFVKNVSQIIGTRKLDKEVAAQVGFLSSAAAEFREAGFAGLLNGLKKETDKNVLPETQRVLMAVKDEKAVQNIKKLLK